VSGLRPTSQAVLAAAVLAAPFCLAGFAFQSGALAGRPLWVDERLTVLVASQRSIPAVLDALRQGADTNPPLLFVWHWVVGRLFGGVADWQLRATALLSMLAATIGLFLLLRRVYGVLPALAGAFVVAGNAQIIRYAFDARFYGPWVLLTVIYLALLARLTSGRRGAGEWVATCLAAAALCLVHYFGIITLALISAGVLLAAYPDRRRMRAVAPGALTGAGTVVALLPMLRGQRAALSVATWVPPASILLAIQFLGPYLLLYVAAAATSRSLREGLRPGEEAAERRAIVAGLLSLALLPLILTGFSFAVQSVMIIRYALPAFLAMGLVSSALFSLLGPRLRMVFAAVLAVAGLSAAATQAADGRAFAARVRGDSITVEKARRAERIIASPSRKELYPLWDVMRGAPDAVVMATVSPERIRVRFPSASDSAGFGNYMLLEQDIGRVHSRLFHLPHQVSTDSLARLRCFVLVEDQDAPLFVQRWMPGATATRLQDHVFLVHGPTRLETGDSHSDCADSIR
jgi:hypothetical protein